jgi:hypothetical protein
MPRGYAALTFTIVVVVASLGHAQQASQTDSVADAARQQKQSKSEPKTPTKKKVYTNADVVPSDAPAGKDSQADPQAASPQGEAAAVTPSSISAGQPATVKNTRAQDHTDTSRLSIFDRPNKDSADVIVVPAGTKITVDVSEENPPRNLPLRVHTAKVVNIVQVGSTVVIPALSKVTIQESTGVMELTDVTIDGVHYELQTDRVLLQQGSMSEVAFTLTKPVTINR